jgi:hypothetical protein
LTDGGFVLLGLLRVRLTLVQGLIAIGVSVAVIFHLLNSRRRPS